MRFERLVKLAAVLMVVRGSLLSAQPTVWEAAATRRASLAEKIPNGIAIMHESLPAKPVFSTRQR